MCELAQHAQAHSAQVHALDPTLPCMPDKAVISDRWDIFSGRCNMILSGYDMMRGIPQCTPTLQWTDYCLAITTRFT